MGHTCTVITLYSTMGTTLRSGSNGITSEVRPGIVNITSRVSRDRVEYSVPVPLTVYCHAVYAG